MRLLHLRSWITCCSVVAAWTTHAEATTRSNNASSSSTKTPSFLAQLPGDILEESITLNDNEFSKIKLALTQILKDEALQKEREARRREKDLAAHKSQHHDTKVSLVADDDAKQPAGSSNRSSTSHHKKKKHDHRNKADELSLIRVRRSIVDFDKDKEQDMSTVNNQDMLPREPLSSRVADYSPDEEELLVKELERAKEEKLTNIGRRRRKREVGMFERAMTGLSPISSRVANEDLYDLFVDYFENGPVRPSVRRRRRSILDSRREQRENSRNNNDLDLTQPMEITFPEADRVTSVVDERIDQVPADFQQQQQRDRRESQQQQQQHQVHASLVPLGSNTKEQQPDTKLTHDDIRDVTKNSDLSQILNWLEAISQGREHDVTAALLVAKKKRGRESTVQGSVNRRPSPPQPPRENSRRPADPPGPTQRGTNETPNLLKSPLPGEDLSALGPMPTTTTTSTSTATFTTASLDRIGNNSSTVQPGGANATSSTPQPPPKGQQPKQKLNSDRVEGEAKAPPNQPPGKKKPRKNSPRHRKRPAGKQHGKGGKRAKAAAQPDNNVDMKEEDDTEEKDSTESTVESTKIKKHKHSDKVKKKHHEEERDVQQEVQQQQPAQGKEGGAAQK